MRKQSKTAAQEKQKSVLCLLPFGFNACNKIIFGQGIVGPKQDVMCRHVMLYHAAGDWADTAERGARRHHKDGRRHRPAARSSTSFVC